MAIPTPIPTITNFNFTGIKFYRNTETNQKIAGTQTGADSFPPDDEIRPVSLATGTITFDGGGGSPNTVTGVGTAFVTDFRVGQFLFYYDALGNPSLVGKIAAIGNNSTLTLEDVAAATKTDVFCGSANAIIARNETILVAIPTALNGTSQKYIPIWNAYREAPPSAGSFNNETNMSLSQISGVNAPGTPISPVVNIPFTISPLITWDSYIDSTLGYSVTFPSVSSMPSVCWAELRPNGGNGVTLAPNTLYRLFVEEAVNNNALLITTKYPTVNLQQAGYPIS